MGPCLVAQLDSPGIPSSPELAVPGSLLGPALLGLRLVAQPPRLPCLTLGLVKSSQHPKFPPTSLTVFQEIEMEQGRWHRLSSY